MKRLPIVAAGVLSAAIIPRDGWALGLGELTLYSYLNEPFRAEVALLEADALDDNDVHVDLASDTEFERLGVSRDFFLTSINFQVESDESGRRVVLTTEAPLREPYLDFVVEARWPDGRLLREYTVLIDLPPRPVVAARQDTPIEEAAQSDEQAMVSGAETASARAGGYATDAASRPSPGSQYLVTNTDTLWRIASDGAAAGVSVEQTMLEIVAANPAAFQAGNINGLKSGYVLQIPEADDIRIDLATALDEVALQNEEWARGVARESQGLTLVADEETEAAEASESAPDETIISDDAGLLTEGDADLSDEAPTDVAGASTADELDALMTTVSQLQESVDSLEAQLAERDAELDSLRAALAEQQAATPVPVVVETPAAPSTQPSMQPTMQRTSVSQPMPLWPFLAGLAALLAGAGLLIWRRVRRNAESEPWDHADLQDAPPAEEIDEARSPPRLSDPQIMASKAVEEAQIYIAYGRTDQAVEVLSDALAEGLSSATLNMCLLECYVELEQFAEAGALLGRLEQGGNPELLERARQMLLDAGMTLASPSGDAMAQRSDERVEESEEASVLSELSFSAEPAFDLNDGQHSDPEPEPEVAWKETRSDPAPANDEQPLKDDVAEDGALEGYSLEEAFGAANTAPIDIDPVDVDEETSVLDAELSALDSPLDLQEAEAEPEVSLSSLGDEQGLQLAPLDGAVDDPAPETGADSGKLEEIIPSAAAGPDTSGLALTPLDDDADAAEAPAPDNVDMDESIYGVETNPVDSKLDLARAYLDMGDEDGARPVLMEVIKEGDLAQQAEARELLLRLEAS